MKALVYTSPHHLEYRDEPNPVVESGDSLVKVEAVGICGSDMHAYQGHDSRRVAPLILGHEVAGTVIEGPLTNKRVVINPLVTCGVCPACVSGRENICADRQIISMAPRQGAFAEYVTIPPRNLLELPDTVDTVHAALVEPIATAWHAVRKAQEASAVPMSDARALVYGGGAVGLAAALSLRAMGCTDIHLAETNGMRRKTVTDTGACYVFNPLELSLQENSVDIVIDCVGAAATRAGASTAIKPGGVIAHVGLLDNADGLDVRKITLQEITFVGCYTYTMADFRATLDALATGKFGTIGWTEQRALSDGITAFDDLLNGRIAAAKVVLQPEFQT